MRPLRRTTALMLACCFVAVPAYAQEQPANHEALPRLLPEDLEIELALSALPGHLRAEAAVYVLKRGEGFVPAREGANAYTCYVQRTLWYRDKQNKNALIPMCFDEVGAETFVPLDFHEAKYREEGLSNPEIRVLIEKGFAEGKYKAPSSPGIAFMLSPIQEITDPEGEIFRFVPHYMFYAPGLTNEELGLGVKWLFNMAAINREGPHGMFIVRVGEQERQMIEEDAKDLIARVKAWIDQGS